MDPQVIQIIIQGGAVGILVLFGFGAYRVLMQAMSYVNAVVSNHLSHISDSMDRLADKVAEYLDRENR